MSNNEKILKKLEQRRSEISTHLITCKNEEMVKQLEDEIYHIHRQMIAIKAIEEEKQPKMYYFSHRAS